MADEADQHQPDVRALEDLLGRELTADELAVAGAMLTGPMSWSGDRTQHRAFVDAELHAWTTARAGGDITGSPYRDDEQLRTVWAAAFARAQAAAAIARQAAAPGPTDRTVRFWDARSGETLGTATLTTAGELKCSTPSVVGILHGRVKTLGVERAFLSYVDWSNGYVVSSEI